MKKELKRISTFICVLLTIAILAACANKEQADKTPSIVPDVQPTAQASQIAGGSSIRLDYASNPYMVLVNKSNKIPDDWLKKVTLVDATNTFGDQNKVEEKAYEAFLELREDLMKNDSIHIELDSAYRSVEAQQETVDYFTKEYGAEYAATYAAVPGYSEHHTGLALDIYLVDPDGTDIFMNEDMLARTEEFAKVHAKLARYGFILRYLEGKKDITGYAYEPWHLRYINDIEVAQEIMDRNINFEEYLGLA